MKAMLAALALSTAFVLAQTVPAPDRTFVMDAARGGMLEVELGKIAVNNSQNPEVRSFGQRMIDDHSKVNEHLKQLAQSKKITLPASLNASQQAQVTKLSALTGPAFDRAYMPLMVADHKEDIAAFEKEASSGKDPDIKRFAADTLPLLREHLQIAERIETQLGTSAPPATGAGRSKKK